MLSYDGSTNNDDICSNRDPIPLNFKDRFNRCILNSFDQLVKESLPLEKQLLRVYVGSKSETGTMSHFSIIEAAVTAIRLRNRGWTIEYLDSSEVRKKDWPKPKCLVD